MQYTIYWKAIMEDLSENPYETPKRLNNTEQGVRGNQPPAMEVGTNIRENQPTSVEVGTNFTENQPTSMEVGNYGHQRE